MVWCGVERVQYSTGRGGSGAPRRVQYSSPYAQHREKYSRAASSSYWA